jgi:hypothetical protein
VRASLRGSVSTTERKSQPRAVVGLPFLTFDPASLQLEANWDAEWERNLSEAALEPVKRQIDPKDVLVFDLRLPRSCGVSALWS